MLQNQLCGVKGLCCESQVLQSDFLQHRRSRASGEFRGRVNKIVMGKVCC